MNKLKNKLKKKYDRTKTWMEENDRELLFFCIGGAVGIAAGFVDYYRLKNTLTMEDSTLYHNRDKDEWVAFNTYKDGRQDYTRYRKDALPE